MKILLKSLAAFILLVSVSCGANHSKFVELNESENISETTGDHEFESQWFSYPDSTYRSRINVCVVKYYVEDNVLYTSEKYHFLTLAYSWNNDNSLAYQHIIFFDKLQEPDENGWYRVAIEEDNIPREPNTHLSGIMLRNYIGDKYKPSTGDAHADAYLYNTTEEISAGKDRNTISPELMKLYPIIK